MNDLSSQAPPVMRTVHVPLSPDQAFTVFTEQIGQWWPLSSHSVFASETASVAFEDGQLLERSQTGESAAWGEVLLWEPPHRLAFTWHPGRPNGPMTEVAITFQPVDEGTQVLLRHSGWERLEDAADSTRESYDSVGGWTMVVDSFVRHSTVA